MKIFIGYEAKQEKAAKVLEHSLRINSSKDLDIVFLDTSLAESVCNRPYHPLQSTEFTFYRFYIPMLCGYKGYSLYMDCDMLVLGDINEVLTLNMEDLALRVVKQDYTPATTTKMKDKTQTSYYRKNWSSFMLMNNQRLGLWDKQVIETWPGLDLHQFRGIPDSAIGNIPKEWNSLDHWDPSTKNIHYTSGGPWLGIDHPYGYIWKSYDNQKN